MDRAAERKPAIVESIFSTRPEKGASVKRMLISSENVNARSGERPELLKKQADASAKELATAGSCGFLQFSRTFLNPLPSPSLSAARELSGQNKSPS